ncbi:ABC transporter substrate-binding protein [Candidatus Gottesmanbacteria bacterium]|nr:ABC transporter substrate-binding protein [Candidatus Gottesmanbacteria bacterium]
MALFRRSRFLILVTRELTRKYTFPLALGFLVGLVGMVAFRGVLPRIAHQIFEPTIRIGMVGEVGPASLPLDIQRLLGAGLTKLDPDGVPQPELATKWEATDSGRTYAFTIRENATWHSGRPVQANDINYNIRDVTFTVTGPYAIRATLKEPFAPFLTLVTKPILQTGLRGFGPYRVANVRLKGESVQYLRLEPVTEKKAPNREYRFYRTENGAITAFQLGDVDVLTDLTSPGIFGSKTSASVSASPRYDRVVALYFNTKESLLSEKGVRQALAFAVPDLGYERAYSPIAKFSWAYADDIKRYDYNPSQVKRLLSGARIASQSANLTITTFSQFVDVAQKIATSWTNLGVPTAVQVVNELGPFQVLLSAQPIPPDPDQYPLWHSTQSSTNLTGYVNAKIDKLLEDGRKELDIEKRKKIYADFTKRLVEDVPAAFLYYPTTYTVTRRK